VAPVEENLMKHHLIWFGHIKRRPLKAPVCSRIISRTSNGKRVRGRWEKSVKRDLKDWSIIKKLALDRREWKVAIYVPEP
jgi:hypothetical protein